MAVTLLAAGLALVAISVVPAAAGPLPFPDGTYVTDPALCRLTDRQRSERYGDELVLMVRHVEGNRLTDGYEMVCTVLSAGLSGNTVRYRTRCNMEGRWETATGTMTRLSESSFRIGTRTFRSCGRLAR